MAKKIYTGVQELIGNTPLLEVTNIEKEKGLKATLLVKLEYLNPAGSVKDRIAKNMIEDAEARGLLKPGATIIEPTSGNTGIGLASIAASKGYRLILTMPETMSVERRNILKAYGAEIVLTEGTKGMTGAIAKAKELQEKIPGSFLTGQFDNPANPAAHIATTRTGNLEGHRRRSRHFCGRRGNRRNHYRCGRISESAEAGGKGCGSGAIRLTRAF